MSYINSIYPCLSCNHGWTTYSSDCIETCMNSCEKIKEYAKLKMEDTTIVNRLIDQFNSSSNHNCLTCKHYNTVLTSDSSLFHIHNYCAFWNRSIPEQNNEIDNGLAYCHGYKSKAN